MTSIQMELQRQQADSESGRNHLRYIAYFAKAVWRKYWLRRARRATVLILQSLDDRTLRDIGISSSEIHSCVYGEASGPRRQFWDHQRIRLRPPAAAAASRRGS